MKKSKNKNIKSNVVFKMSSEEATLIKMPKYNGYQGGYGAHGDTKYNRAKEKERFEKENW